MAVPQNTTDSVDRHAVIDLRRWLAAASDMVRVVNANAPVDELLASVASKARLLLDLDMCAVMLYDEPGRRLVVRGHDGLSREYVEKLNSSRPLLVAPVNGAYTGPSARAYVTGETIAIENVQASADFTHWQDLARREGYNAIIATPLVDDRRRVGAIVGYSHDSREFTATQIELLQLLAEHAGAALQTARLRSSAQEMIEKLNSANGELVAQRHALESAQDQHRRLMQVMANDVGVSGVVTMLAELLQASVTVEDPQGNVIASAAVGTYLSPPNGRDRDFEPVQKALDRVSRDRVGAVQVQGPRGPASRFWLAPVTLGDDVVAVLWVSIPRAGVAEVDVRGIERFALALALEIAKQRSRLQAHIGVSRDLVADLLSDVRESQYRDLFARSEALGHDLRSPQTVVVATADNRSVSGGRRPLDVSRIVELANLMARRAHLDVLVGSLDQDAIILIANTDPHVSSAREYAAALQRAVGRTRTGGSASVVIGTSADSPSAIPDAFVAARGALRLATRSRSQVLVDLGDYGINALLLTNPNPEPLIHFAEKLLNPLRERDAKKQSDLVTTLRTWFDCNCSTSLASEALVLHPNTVIYRMRVIEDMLGRSLKDHGFLAELRLALMALDVSGAMHQP